MDEVDVGFMLGLLRASKLAWLQIFWLQVCSVPSHHAFGDTCTSSTQFRTRFPQTNGLGTCGYMAVQAYDFSGSQMPSQGLSKTKGLEQRAHAKQSGKKSRCVLGSAQRRVWALTGLEGFWGFSRCMYPLTNDANRPWETYCLSSLMQHLLSMRVGGLPPLWQALWV